MKQAKIPFSQLLRDFSNQYVPYEALLKTVEWQERREQIFKRDNKKCQKCGKWATTKFDTSVGDARTEGEWVWADELVEFADPSSSSYTPPQIFGPDAKYFGLGQGDVGWLPMIYASKPHHLELHHRYYLRSALPWQYEDEALITLCNWCHREVHANGASIPVYPSQSARDAVLRHYTNSQTNVGHYTSCSRCNGTGSLPMYNHVQAGVCFRCNGAGFAELREFWIG